MPTIIYWGPRTFQTLRQMLLLSEFPILPNQRTLWKLQSSRKLPRGFVHQCRSVNSLTMSLISQGPAYTRKEGTLHREARKNLNRLAGLGSPLSLLPLHQTLFVQPCFYSAIQLPLNPTTETVCPESLAHTSWKLLCHIKIWLSKFLKIIT